MFGKLIKNEFRNIGKLLLLINTIVLGMHLLSIIFEQIYYSRVLGRTIFENIFAIFAGIYILSIFAVNIIIVLVFAVRFYKKVYSIEGYLTHTLPVKKSGIYFAMLISSSIGTIITIAISLGYPFIRIVNEFLATGKATLNDLFMAAARYNVTGLTYFLFILGAVCSVFATFSLVFLCISIGQNWKAHPMLGSIISYWVITTALQIFGATAILSFANTSKVDNIVNNINNPGDVMNMVACLGIEMEVVGIAIMSVISIIIMKKKLNL